MSSTEVDILNIKLDILIDDFKVHKKIMFSIWKTVGVSFVGGAIAVSVAFIK